MPYKVITYDATFKTTNSDVDYSLKNKDDVIYYLASMINESSEIDLKIIFPNGSYYLFDTWGNYAANDGDSDK